MTNSLSCLAICLTAIERPTLSVLSGPKDPIPLWHFGLKEMLAKVDLLEDQFDHPMAFNEAQVPPNPFVPRQGVGPWGKGIAVYGAARGYR